MIIITDPQFLRNEAKVINALFAEGLDTLHLRKPDASVDQLSDLISEIDSRFHSKIMIHNHYLLTGKFSLKGIHFTEKTKSNYSSFEFAKCSKSWAVHELEELDVVPTDIDYVLFSPLFESISKQGYGRKWNLEELKSELRKNHSFKKIALGGINQDNFQKAYDLGFDDVAVLGCIWENYKISNSISEVIGTYNSFRK